MQSHSDVGGKLQNIRCAGVAQVFEQISEIFQAPVDLGVIRCEGEIIGQAVLFPEPVLKRRDEQRIVPIRIVDREAVGGAPRLRLYLCRQIRCGDAEERLEVGFIESRIDFVQPSPILRGAQIPDRQHQERGGVGVVRVGRTHRSPQINCSEASLNQV